MRGGPGTRVETPEAKSQRECHAAKENSETHSRSRVYRRSDSRGRDAPSCRADDRVGDGKGMFNVQRYTACSNLKVIPEAVSWDNGVLFVVQRKSGVVWSPQHERCVGGGARERREGATRDVVVWIDSSATLTRPVDEALDSSPSRCF
jgi:hypothetical protein